jgi:hypothetical protein
MDGACSTNRSKRNAGVKVRKEETTRKTKTLMGG